MTTEQKLEILKRAIEMGAEIDFTFFLNDDKKEAENIADKFPELDKNELEYNGAHWFSMGNRLNGFSGSVHYEVTENESSND